ncbi:MAG: tripartite tricarboxylate transporter TctB family protein [Rhodocyclaceae bacterium]|nr:tripartite tricarboxylate transporter TctB family protein [Rhodocyclaceae bacterium]
MQDNHNNEGGFVSNKTMEIVTALIILFFGAVVMWDSYRIGAGWGSDGPESGSFPFYIGLLIIISSVVTIFNAVRESDKDEFVGKGEFGMVMAVLIPAIIYVIAIDFIGIYVASAIFITVFMVWQGKFSILKSLMVAIPVNVFFFFMFEVWFKIPLPKAWLEAQFGY